MEYIFIFFVGALIAVGVLAIILKITNKIPYMNIILMFVSSVALVYISFTASHTDGNIEFKTIILQYVCAFCFYLFLQADYAFDVEEYVSTTIYDEGDHYRATSRLDSGSNFWTVLLLALFLPLLCIAILYVVFGLIRDSLLACHVIGWIGIALVAWGIIRFIKFIITFIRAKRRY